MDSPFERLGKEERQDWLDHPVTQAFVASLAHLEKAAEKTALFAVKAGEPETTHLAQLGGRLNTFDDINTLLRRASK